LSLSRLSPHTFTALTLGFLSLGSSAMAGDFVARRTIKFKPNSANTTYTLQLTKDLKDGSVAVVALGTAPKTQTLAKATEVCLIDPTKTDTSRPVRTFNLTFTVKGGTLDINTATQTFAMKLINNSDKSIYTFDVKAKAAKTLDKAGVVEVLSAPSNTPATGPAKPMAAAATVTDLGNTSQYYADPTVAICYGSLNDADPLIYIRK
jgi:hypothetical protein